MQSAYSALDGQYILHETIGSGGFAKVKLATHMLTGDKVAIKIMDKKGLGDDLSRVETEIKALKDLNHQNICRLYQIIETKDKIFLVIEYCCGGELFDYIVKKDRLSESEARHFFRQIIAAVHYVHFKGYSHRDLKPENLLITGDLQLKLIDFGLCSKPETLSKYLETCCGSPAYAAPELIAGRAYFGNEADVWSMGVLLYALLCGFLPFEDENLQIMYQKIQVGKYLEPSWLSESSRLMLKSMLQPNPKRRTTVEELLRHPWVVHNYFQPLKWQSIYNADIIDNDCIVELAMHFDTNFDEMKERIQKWEYDYTTATYFILSDRKRKRLSIVLPPALKPISSFVGKEPNFAIIRSPTIHASLENNLDKATGNWTSLYNMFDQKEELTNSYQEAVKNTEFLMPTPCSSKIKRYSSEANTSQYENEKENIRQSSVSPKVKVRLLDHKENANSNQTNSNRNSVNVYSTPVTTRVLGENRTPFSNIQKLHVVYPDTPFSAQLKLQDDNITSGPYVRSPRTDSKTPKFGRRVFTSVERKVDRVINMLTPKRYRTDNAGPTRIREANTDMVNISTTSAKSPEKVLNELLSVFSAKGISCKQKGWTIRGKAKDANGRTSLTLELEVVHIDRLDMVGVKRKRLNGDSFMYKRICEDVLNLASL